MDVAIGQGPFHSVKQTKEDPVPVISSQENDLSQDLLAFISWDEKSAEESKESKEPKKPKEPKEPKKPKEPNGLKISREKQSKESKRTQSSDAITPKRVESIQVDNFLNSVFG